MKIKLLFILVTTLFIFDVSAQNYKIDASHSTVQIQVERFGVVDVSGRFKDVQGSIYYSSEDISKTKGEAIIKVSSYDANNEGGEKAVKGVFLQEDTYPDITFSSSKAIIVDSKSYLQGQLTIHGVTKEIKLPFSIKGPLLDLPTRKQSIAFNASITINRQDYGIKFDRKLPNGVSLVGNDVKITLLILAIEE